IDWSAIHVAGNAPRRGGALFDSAAAAHRENDHRCAGGIIDSERKKKLSLDVDLLFDQHGLDWELSDFHRQHARRVVTNILRFFRESDAADPGASSGPRLNFYHDLAA